MDFSYARVWGGNTTFQSSLEGMTSLKSVNFSNTTFGCSFAYIRFNGMFRGCTSLETVDMTGVTLEKPLAAFDSMFSGCENLTSFKYDLDTSRVESMGDMFKDCSSLASVDLSKMDGSNVTDIIGIFEGCTYLQEYKLPSNLHPLYIDRAFGDCRSLTHIDLSFYDFTGTASENILKNCTNLKSFTVNTRVPKATTLYLPFDKGWAVSTDPDFKNVTTVATDSNGLALFPNVTGTTTFVRRSAYLTEGSCFTFNSYNGRMTLFGNVSKEEIRNFSQKASVKSINALDGTVFPADSSELFQSFYNLEDVWLNNVDTSNVTTMENMFRFCSNIGKAGHAFEIDQWDTSNVTDLSSMFERCENLRSSSWLRNWDTSSVTSTAWMFVGCTSLTEFDGRRWDTSNFTNLELMFDGCSSLSSVHVENWKTDKVINTKSMFRGCSSLTELTLGTKGTANDPYEDCWHLSSDTLYSGMFGDCTSLQKLNIFNIQLREGDFARWFFSNTPSLREIGLGGGAQVSSNMWLDNTYGWTSSRSYARVSGTDKYAVFTAPENCYTVFSTMEGFAPVDFSASGSWDFYTADRPYPGNTTDLYTSYAMGRGFTVDHENSGWYDINSESFLSKTDCIQVGSAYIYRVRLVPDAAKYFEQPTEEMLSKIKFYDFKSPTMQYLKANGAHLNEDGTLDIYASVLRQPIIDGVTSSYYIAQPKAFTGYYLPEGSFSENIANGKPCVITYKMFPFCTGTYNVTPTSIDWKKGLVLVENAFDDCSYELSIDGENYVPMSAVNGVPFTGLTPSTEYTIYIRLAGEAEPFYSEKVFTAIDNSTPATLSTASVSFGGAIGLNYYVALGDNIKNDPGAYAEFTVNGKTIRQMVSETPVDSKGFNKFTCPVYATQMRDNINFKLCNGNGERYDMKTASGVDCSENGFDYTVAKYLTAICSSTSNTKMADFARAALDYGAAAQIYFGYNAENLSCSSVASLDTSVFDQYKAVKSGTMPTGVSGVSVSVVFDSDNSLKFYYIFDNGVSPAKLGLNYYIDGKKATLQHSSARLTSSLYREAQEHTMFLQASSPTQEDWH